MTRYDAVKCDRCGLERLASTTDPGFAHIGEISVALGHAVGKERDIDLCSPCFKEFKLFLSEFKNKTEREIMK